METKSVKIRGYPNYSIYSDGRVYSHVSNRFIAPGRTKKGYLVASLWSNGVGRSVYIHRLVAEAFIPNPDNKPQVNHKDEDKSNNREGNLEWSTPGENLKHSAKSRCRMTAKDVVTAKEMSLAGKSRSEIAKTIGFTTVSVSHVLRGDRDYLIK